MLSSSTAAAPLQTALGSSAALQVPVITFSPSTRVRQRLLVLTNPTKYDLVFKVRADSGCVVLDPPHGQLKAADTAVIVVYAEPGKKCPSNLGVLSVYARPVKSVKPINFAAWFNEEPSNEKKELAYKISIERRSDFAALETVCDLPGNACFVESVPFPVRGLQDDDTKTAIGIDADTKTARRFAIRDIDEALPSESALSTCHNVLSDTQTAGNILSDVRTARNSKDIGWIEWIFSFLFPIGSAEDANGIHQTLRQTEFQPCGVAIFGKSSEGAAAPGPRF